MADIVLCILVWFIEPKTPIFIAGKILKPFMKQLYTKTKTPQYGLE